MQKLDHIRVQVSQQESRLTALHNPWFSKTYEVNKQGSAFNSAEESLTQDSLYVNNNNCNNITREEQLGGSAATSRGVRASIAKTPVNHSKFAMSMSS